MRLALKKKHIPWIIVSFVLIVDQTLKIWVKTNMHLGQEIHVLGNWFILHFTENNGMAFGMEFAGENGKLFLSVFRIIAIGFIIWYLRRLILKNENTGLIACISLILVGALGNVVDSAFYGIIFNDSLFQVAEIFPAEGGYAGFLHGKVVDMFYFPILEGTYPSWMPFKAGEHYIFFRPVFNIADSAITTGVFILLIFQRRFFHNDLQKNKPVVKEVNALKPEASFTEKEE